MLDEQQQKDLRSLARDWKLIAKHLRQRTNGLEVAQARAYERCAESLLLYVNQTELSL